MADPIELARRGREALEAGDTQAARRWFERAIEETDGAPSGDPARVDALRGLVRAHSLEHELQLRDDPLSFYRALSRLLDDVDPFPNLVKADTHKDFALALADAGEQADAEERIAEVVEYLELVLGSDDGRTRDALHVQRRILDSRPA